MHRTIVVRSAIVWVWVLHGEGSRGLFFFAELSVVIVVVGIVCGENKKRMCESGIREEG